MFPPPSKTYICKKCQKGFGSANALRQHCLATQHIVLFSCPKCQKTFTQECSLKQHLQSIRHTPQHHVPQHFIAQFQISQYQKPHYHKSQRKFPPQFLRPELQKLAEEIGPKKNNPPNSSKEIRENIRSRRTTVYQEQQSCPPHQFILFDPHSVGYGLGDGAENRSEEMVEICVKCGKKYQEFKNEM